MQRRHEQWISAASPLAADPPSRFFKEMSILLQDSFRKGLETENEGNETYEYLSYRLETENEGKETYEYLLYRLKTENEGNETDEYLLYLSSLQK